MNSPRITIELKGDQNKLWQLLSDRLGTVRDVFLYRVKCCKEAVPVSASILYIYGAFEKRLPRTDSANELPKNRRATVSLGYIGLYGVASAFFGGEWGTNPEARTLTFDIVRELKVSADVWGDEYGYHSSAYSTPSESLTDHFCRLDTEKFGIIENITDKEYYTNSFHCDMRKNSTPLEKLESEEDYPEYCSGGFIHYCKYPMPQQNPKALETVWDFVYDKIGYLDADAPIDHCYQCGFEGDFEPIERGFEYPECGNRDPKTCDVVKRTCGYLGSPQARPMVHGHHKEISPRVKHMK